MSSIPGDGPLSFDGYMHDFVGRGPSPLGLGDFSPDMSEEVFCQIASVYEQEPAVLDYKPASVGGFRCQPELEPEQEQLEPFKQSPRMIKSQSTTVLDMPRYSHLGYSPEPKSLLSASIPPLDGVKEQWGQDPVHDGPPSTCGYSENTLERDPSPTTLATNAVEKWNGGPPKYPYDQGLMANYLRPNDENASRATSTSQTCHHDPNHYFSSKPPYNTKEGKDDIGSGPYKPTTDALHNYHVIHPPHLSHRNQIEMPNSLPTGYIESYYKPMNGYGQGQPEASESTSSSYNGAAHLAELKQYRQSQMRRALSTGDIHNGTVNFPGDDQFQGSALQLQTKHSSQYRKQSIIRYRQKRDQRNFEKKIKYNCRKTLADSRPRVRGRFARKDEEAMLREIAQRANKLDCSTNSME